MEVLIGASAIVLLVPFFILVVFLMKVLPPEFSLGAVVLMLAGDGAIAALWYYGGMPFIEEVKLFKLGIGMAFVLTTIFKVCYLVLDPSTRKLLMDQ